MARIVEEKQYNNLKKNGIEIQTKYFDKDKTVVVSTNNNNPDIDNGIILEKVFLKDNCPLKILKEYDSRVQYKFIKSNEEEKEITCPNCNNKGLGKEFINGCPYCHTSFNIEYKEKELGNKQYYDLVMKSNNYILKTFIVDIIFCLIVCLIYILVTGRTFNIYDIVKVGVGGLLLGLICFFIFYQLDAVIISNKVRRIKEQKNNKQKKFFYEMNSLGITKDKLLNDFNYELRNNLYKDENVIDYDIKDYLEYKKEELNNELVLTIKVDIRIIKYDKELIINEQEKEYKLVRRNINTIKLKEGKNIIKCPNCSASINVNDEKCSYCGTEINKYQEWYLLNK